MIEQGGTAEAAHEAVDRMMDGMTNGGNFLVADWYPKREMAAEQ